MSYLPRFDEKWTQHLGPRAATIRRALEMVEQLHEPPYHIVETGCVRAEPGTANSHGDGSSTMVWDEFVNHHGGLVRSCDISRENCELAQRHCSDKVEFLIGDSVHSLLSFTEPADLLYLDSFDLDWNNPHPSALHHLQEMASAARLLVNKSVVLIDDCGVNGGKGLYVTNWLMRIGAKLVMRHYQHLWELP